jgi:hypothetical protein
MVKYLGEITLIYFDNKIKIFTTDNTNAIKAVFL